MKMRFYELEIDLQNRMNKANYKNSSEIKNIINNALKESKNLSEFKELLAIKLKELTEYTEQLICDVYDYKIQDEIKHQM